MAFISPALPLNGLRRGLLAMSPRHRSGRGRARAARWTSLAKSHPYGNGGLPDKPDYSNWDEARLRADIAEAERLFVPHGSTPADMSVWAIVMSADILQWNNNLFTASQEHGFEWDLRGINVVRMAEATARKCIEHETFDLWVLEMGNDGVLSFTMHEKDVNPDDGKEVLLTFSIQEEAQRFADQLEADGHTAKLRLVPIQALKNLCVQDEMLLGLVPAKTLVSPAQFNMTF